jgi:hypothetical protein
MLCEWRDAQTRTAQSLCVLLRGSSGSGLAVLLLRMTGMDSHIRQH